MCHERAKCNESINTKQIELDEIRAQLDLRDEA